MRKGVECVREIKFRAWDCNSKKWYPRVQVGTNCCHAVYDEEHKQWCEFDELCGEIMQYTGLKDKNGKEIYEGDIVNSHSGLNHVYLREVVRCDDRPTLEFKPSTGYVLCEANEHLFEVIGNIYENPELLGGDNK
jgi:hypothetical protein